jgi:hypothetical protein
MRQVKTTVMGKVVQRIAIVACAAILGVAATACGASDSNVTPGAPAPTNAPAATSPPQSGGAGF